MLWHMALAMLTGTAPKPQGFAMITITKTASIVPPAL